MSLPESDKQQKVIKFYALYSLQSDFVRTACQYAKIIICEYFLHIKGQVMIIVVIIVMIMVKVMIMHDFSNYTHIII